MRPALRPEAALLVALLAACDAGDAAVGREAAALPCETVSLERDAAEPLEWVGVEGVPDSAASAVVVETRLPDGDTVAALPHRVDPELAFVAPAHPDGIGGGRFEIRIRTASHACPFVAFTALPMQPSPGALDEVVDAVEEAVHARAALFGVSPAELRTADPNELPPPAVPLALAQAILDQPLDDPSAGASPAEADTLEDTFLPVVEAAWARDSVAADVRAHTSGIALTARGDTAGAAEAMGRSARSASSTARPAMRGFLAAAPLLARPARREWTPPPAEPVEPQDPEMWNLCGLDGMDSALEPTAEELDCMMRTSRMADLASSGKPKEIFDWFEKTLAVGELLGELSGNKLIEKGYAGAGKVASAYITMAEALAKILPSSLERLEVTLSQTVFLEDDPGPGVVSNLTVVALSRGWRAEEWSNTVFGPSSPGLEDMADAATNEVKARTDNDKLLDIEPREFGPTDISSGKWSHVTLSGEAFEKLDHLTYAPRRVGQATLDIQSEMIGYQVIRSQEELEVRPIRIEVDPPRATRTPGERVTYTATVENAEDRTLSWHVIQPGHQLITAGDERLGATLVTAEDPSTFPIRIRVESEADRSHLAGARPRVAEARVGRYQLHVTPAGLCIQPGEREQFEAEVPEVDVGGVVLLGDDSPVSWSATAGGIDEDGGFQAPDHAVGVVTITAQSLADPDLEGEVRVRVGGCDCWMMGTVGPPLSGPVSGVAHLAPDGGVFPTAGQVSSEILSLNNHSVIGPAAPGGGGPVVSLRFVVPGLAEAGEGVLPISHAWAEATLTFMSMVDPSVPSSGGGTVRVTKRSEGVVEGEVTASLAVFWEDGEMLKRDETYPTYLSVRFRAVTGTRADRTSGWGRCLLQAGGF